MTSKLKQYFFDAIDEFSESVKNNLSNRLFTVTNTKGKSKIIKVNNKRKRVCLTTICSIKDRENVFNDFLEDLAAIRKHLIVTSSPRAFKAAWDIRTNVLNSVEADLLAREGAQFIPEGSFNNSRIFKTEQQGILLGKQQRSVLGIRHNEGNYEDDLNNFGQFTYFPAMDLRSMLRFRWIQYISKKMNIPVILLVVMWFKLEGAKSGEDHLFVIAPAKVIEMPPIIVNDTNLEASIKLEIITRKEAEDIISRFYALNDTTTPIEIREHLPELIAREWSYEKIKASLKGRKIKKWAMDNGYTCPSDRCGHKSFSALTYSEISFGHIVSQDWAKAFRFLLEKKDHPDNLYLTCKNCNSSLGANFPDKKLVLKILENGTIGDWLRNYEPSIRSIRELAAKIN